MKIKSKAEFTHKWFTQVQLVVLLFKVSAICYTSTQCIKLQLSVRIIVGGHRKRADPGAKSFVSLQN